MKDIFDWLTDWGNLWKIFAFVFMMGILWEFVGGVIKEIISWFRGIRAVESPKKAKKLRKRNRK